MLDHLRRLWEHVFWADERLREAIEAPGPPLPPEALREYAHLLGAEETWLARLEQRPPRAAVWPSPAETGALAERIHAGYRAYLAALDVAALVVPVPYTNSAGRTFANTPADILLHTALHGQYHRGRINLLLRQAGRDPAPVDYIAFVRGAPAATSPGAG